MSTPLGPRTAFPPLIVRGANAIKVGPYGTREGRIRDLFGHLWILSQQVAQ